MVRLLVILALLGGEPGAPRDPPREGASDRAAPPSGKEEEEASPDPDAELLRDLELLENLELLRVLDLLDAGAPAR